MSEQKHTPTPWTVGPANQKAHEDSHAGIHGADGFIVAEVQADVEELPAGANAAFIVKACNSHDALVEALKELRFSLAFDGQICPINQKRYLEDINAALAAAEAA